MHWHAYKPVWGTDRWTEKPCLVVPNPQLLLLLLYPPLLVLFGSFLPFFALGFIFPRFV